MTGHKKPGRSRKAGRSRRPPERRVPPPDGTGREAKFLRERIEAGSTVVIHLANGETVHGAIERFDREMITVGSESGPHVVLRKRDIRYIEES
jgi:sRNA-binding regulator protein Hfq